MPDYEHINQITRSWADKSCRAVEIWYLLQDITLALQKNICSSVFFEVTDGTGGSGRRDVETGSLLNITVNSTRYLFAYSGVLAFSFPRINQYTLIEAEKYIEYRPSQTESSLPIPPIIQGENSQLVSGVV